MSAAKAKTLKTIRGKDLKIRYTQDNSQDTLVIQRQFYDGTGKILTPITAKLLERQVATNNPTIAKLGDNTKPRRLLICFGSIATLSGESNFTVIVPYSPGDTGHNEHIREIFNYVSTSENLDPKYPLNVNYNGENQG